MCNHKKYTENCQDCEYRFLRVKNYSYKPNLEFKGRSHNKRYFGIELEVECNDCSPEEVLFAIKEDLTDVWEFKTDGSLSYGMEFISQPITLCHWTTPTLAGENYLGWIKSLPKCCRSHDTKTCGLHVHVNRNSLTDEAILKINYFVNMWQSKFEKLGRREWNSYCNNDYYYQTREDTYEYDHDRRYRAVNLTNESTIEFRFFKGTLKISTIKASICLVSAICEIISQMTWNEVKSENSFDNFVSVIKAKPMKEQNQHLLPYLKKKGF